MGSARTTLVASKEKIYDDEEGKHGYSSASASEAAAVAGLAAP